MQVTFLTHVESPASVGASSARPKFVVCPPQLARDERLREGPPQLAGDERLREGGGKLDMQNYAQVRPFVMSYVLTQFIQERFYSTSSKVLLLALNNCTEILHTVKY